MQVLNKEPHPLIGLRGIWFIGWTLNQLFNSGSVGFKEQDVVSEVKLYFDSAKATNNLWMINLLIMVILDGHKYIYSERNATTETLVEWSPFS